MYLFGKEVHAPARQNGFRILHVDLFEIDLSWSNRFVKH